MQYSNLGRSGLKVSRVSLGSWLTLGMAVDDKQSQEIVHGALDLGINLLDTADVYNRGEGELALGRAIAGLRRQDLVLASKCFFPMSDDVNDRGLSRKHIHQSIEQSLLRLGTDYLDLCQCHRPDPETPVEETVLAMHDLITQGKLLYWGVSMWPAQLITEAVAFCRQHALHAPISNQPKYNLFDREIEAEVIPVCQRLGLGQIVFSPLAQGVLTGKYQPGVEPAADTRGGNARVNQFIQRYLTERHLQQAQGLVALAERQGVSAAALALAFCLQQENVSSVIVGASSRQQLQTNVQAVELALSPQCMLELEDLFPA